MSAHEFPDPPPLYESMAPHKRSHFHSCSKYLVKETVTSNFEIGGRWACDFLLSHALYHYQNLINFCSCLPCSQEMRYAAPIFSCATWCQQLTHMCLYCTKPGEEVEGSAGCYEPTVPYCFYDIPATGTHVWKCQHTDQTQSHAVQSFSKCLYDICSFLLLPGSTIATLWRSLLVPSMEGGLGKLKMQ